MADNERSLYIVWNTGSEANVVPARGLHAVWNVGAEAVAVTSRALHAVWNVGTYAVVLARALYAYMAISLRTGGDDPLEMQLIKADLIEIMHILRGK